MPQVSQRQPSSFRDPAGFIFIQDGQLYRQINQSYKKHYDHLISSGCYKALTDKQWLIPHQECGTEGSEDLQLYKIIKPETVAFISYPYEWSFDMLRDAALLTLNIQRESLSYGLTLKDATAYNVQWHRGRMIFIDTLSFELFEEQPWVAYRQFCEQFLAPLLLMHYTGSSLQQLLLAWPEGIPLQEVRRLLPYRSRWSFHTWLHIHLHAKMSRKAAGQAVNPVRFSKQKMLNLITSLELLIKKLKAPQQPSNWQEYYEDAGQRGDYLEAKKQLVTSWVSGLPPLKAAADLGANEGEFSRIVAATGCPTIAADGDPYCINNLYRKLAREQPGNIQPLIIDLANPSPAIGLNNRERDAFFQRPKPELVMALALIHHLAIAKNIPLEDIAELFRFTAKYLLIEFVPKEDPKVQQLLVNRQDIFPHYTPEAFELAFSKWFSVKKTAMIGSSGRRLYLMEKGGWEVW